MTSAVPFIPSRVSDPFQRDTRKFRLLSRLFTADDIRPSPEQFAEFVPYLLIGDAPADAVIQYFMSEEGKRTNARQLFNTLLELGR